ncbi:hypothetical protein EsH8_IV_000772 [Colletotrichum jinshuiense]
MRAAAGAPGKPKDYTGDVCIVSARISGLYVAMMLKHLRIRNIDILEASDRAGGRCYAHSFPGDPDCKHNYHDVGATGIPDIPTMKSTLKLVEILKMEDKKQKYVYDLGYGLPHMYQYKHNFKPEYLEASGRRTQYSIKTSGEKFENAIKDIVEKLSGDFETEFARLMDGDDDNCSTRSCLMVKKKWANAQLLCAPGDRQETALRLNYDETSLEKTPMPFFESLCDFGEFQAAKGKDWCRIDQGMDTVPRAMQEYLSSGIEPFGDGSPIIDVTSTDQHGKPAPAKNYDMVSNTTATAPLQRMDLSKLGLPGHILMGIRALNYDRASKVAFKFLRDQYTGGAFALFGPGQFKHLYPEFQQVFCDNKFTMCGDALSAHHAWTSGALDSAYAAVYSWLVAIGRPGKNKNVGEADKRLVRWAVKLGGAKEPKHRPGSPW